MENAITYLLRKYHTISSENYQIFYDFNSSGYSVNNITGAISLSGSLTGNNTGNFYIHSGLANFSGNSIYIDNSSGNINLQDCTYFTTYQRKNSGDFCLINCIETGEYNNSIYYKGYELGVTANNHLYFTYYNNNGPQVLISNNNVADKSNIFLSVRGNTIGMGDYDFVSQDTNKTLYNINSNYVFQPKSLWISSNLEYTGLYNSNNPFNGNMERFLVFSPSIPASDIRLINSGTVCNYSSGGRVITYTSGLAITGYSTGLLPYFTGVTGSIFAVTGIITDAFGDTYNGYGQVNLTGVLYSQQILPMYGNVQTPNTGYVLESITLNTGAISSYGKSNVNILLNINQNDNVNLVCNTGIQEILNQRNLKSKLANGFSYFSWINSNKNSYNVWTDGLYQYSGQNVPSGDIYNIINVISGDYIVDDRGNIYFNNSFGYLDNIVVDIIQPQEYNTLYIDGFNLAHSSLQLVGDKYYLNWPQQSEVFLNGQKLISGLYSEIGTSCDYGISGSGIYFINTGVFYNLQPSVLLANIETGLYDQVFRSNIFVTSANFANNSSRAYLNGVRLDLNRDYIELGNFDTNLGTGIFDIKQNIIYNGNGGFN
jgi:hypothetical protein